MRPHRRLSDVSNVSNVSIVTRHSYISQGTRHSNVSRNTHGLTQDELREAARQDREERAQREWERAAARRRIREAQYKAEAAAEKARRDPEQLPSGHAMGLHNDGAGKPRADDGWRPWYREVGWWKKKDAPAANAKQGSGDATAKPSAASAHAIRKHEMSLRDELLEKQQTLLELERLKAHGAVLTKGYSTSDPLQDKQREIRRTLLREHTAASLSGARSGATALNELARRDSRMHKDLQKDRLDRERRVRELKADIERLKIREAGGRLPRRPPLSRPTEPFTRCVTFDPREHAELKRRVRDPNGRVDPNDVLRLRWGERT